MKVNNFEVTLVPGESEQRVPVNHEDGSVAMEHGQTYGVRVQSKWNRRAEMNLKIDGRDMGTFNIEAFEDDVLYTTPKDPERGCFTCTLLDTPEGQAMLKDNTHLGHIQVTLRPEIQRRPPTIDYLESNPGDEMAKGTFSSRSGGGPYAAAGTAMTGHSNQQFGSGHKLQLDPAETTIINLRVVGKKPVPQFRSLESFTHQNQVPPRPDR
ncbi:hypothetical protein [Leptolyngbya sp. AN10]|uniref:hypothetical protein n=1 Tax=Leptolyngbya sp. AN10 TaxID=3423365 RepID=UPI003D311CB1